jgi:hypothetical protein
MVLDGKVAHRSENYSINDYIPKEREKRSPRTLADKPEKDHGQQ